MKDKTDVVLLSGGVDSALVLGRLIDDYGPKHILALHMNYGSTHYVQEKAAAVRIACHYNVEFQTIDLRPVFSKMVQSSALLGDASHIPAGNYRDEHMRATYVPGRNLIFMAVAAGIIRSYTTFEGKQARIWSGVQHGDPNTSPDCSANFISYMGKAVAEATHGKVKLLCTIAHMSKKDIIDECLLNNVPLHLTRSCFTSSKVACGVCGNCQRRLEAFATLGEDDPIEYQSRAILPRMDK